MAVARLPCGWVNGRRYASLWSKTIEGNPTILPIDGIILTQSDC